MYKIVYYTTETPRKKATVCYVFWVQRTRKKFASLVGLVNPEELFFPFLLAFCGWFVVFGLFQYFCLVFRLCMHFVCTFDTCLVCFHFLCAVGGKPRVRLHVHTHQRCCPPFKNACRSSIVVHLLILPSSIPHSSQESRGECAVLCVGAMSPKKKGPQVASSHFFSLLFFILFFRVAACVPLDF